MKKNSIIAAFTALTVLGGALSYTGAALPESFITAGAVWYAEQDGITYFVGDDYAKVRLVDSAVAGKVVIPDTIEGKPVTAIGGFAFSDTEGHITELSLPDTVTEIDGFAFSDSRIEAIDLPDSLKEIGQGAFARARCLRSITIPGSVKTFGYGVFEGCINLEKVVFEEGFTDIPEDIFNLGYNNSALTEVVLPEGLKTIGDNAFWGAELKEIYIPGSVEYIGEEAFAYCNELEKAVIGEGVEELGDSTFYHCKSLRDVSLPSTLKNINYFAFECCKSLETIDLPESLEEISDGAFIYSGLRYITIPGSLKHVGTEAFASAELRYIRIPESVESIEYGAFNWCYNLCDVIICNPSCDILFEYDTIYNGYDPDSDRTCTIYGYDGSTAQQYAAEYGLSFALIGTEPPPPEPSVCIVQPMKEYWSEPGDVNCDYMVDANDASMILEYYAYTSTGGIRDIERYFGYSGIIGDVDDDGFIDSNDASLVLDYYAYNSTGGLLPAREYFAQL